MKIILLSIIAAGALGVVAALVLSASQEPAYEVYSTSGTRLSDPGHNLVGPNWSGNPTPSS